MDRWNLVQNQGAGVLLHHPPAPTSPKKALSRGVVVAPATQKSGLVQAWYPRMRQDVLPKFLGKVNTPPGPSTQSAVSVGLLGPQRMGAEKAWLPSLPQTPYL
ncbi:MAG: hypothetical protein DRI40_09360 [Chloroflexi bacterium]|nr:MAG: hypothetical protein DRI40_09360 [Chloroflexota bacterium]